MTKFISQFEYTRTQILKRAKKVSAYFSSGGGDDASDIEGEERQLAWTSEEQIERAKEFRKLAKELAATEKRAA